MAKPPEYRLSAPNTGSYRLSPQAAPVSTYVRPKQINPNLTDYKAQVDSFQNFVKSMADWRATENQDNQGRAQLRALADNARGVLDANLEDEDEDYQKYGRFLQGKNYGKEIGTKLIAEITTGSEGQMGLMDQAFAQSKLPENHNRKVEDIFSEMLEDRKDHYRDQVPDSSDEFYSGFGEAMQPFASEINKAFYEKVQKETFNGRRENFSQSLRLQLETDIQSKDIKFNQDYLRNLSASFSSVAGLSEDAALGESIRILNSEIGQMIENADSEEDLEMAEKMLSIFDTASKGRARLIDIPIFKQDAQTAYTSLGGAIDTQRRALEVKEKQEEEKEIKRQGRALFDDYVVNGKFPSADVLTRDFSKLGAPELRAAFNFSETAKENKEKLKVNTPDYRKHYANLELDARLGILTQDELRLEVVKGNLAKEDFTRISGLIAATRDIDKSILKFIEEEIRLTELTDISPEQKINVGGLTMFEIQNPEGHRKWSMSLTQLGLLGAIEAEKILKSNTEELTQERQLEIMREAITKIQPHIDKHNKLVSGFTQNQKEKEKETPKEITKPIPIALSATSSIDVGEDMQKRYLVGDDGGRNLYNDYYDYIKSIRGSGSALGPDNIFSNVEGGTFSEKRESGKRLFIGIQIQLMKRNGNLPGGKKFGEWVTTAIKDDVETAIRASTVTGERSTYSTQFDLLDEVLGGALKSLVEQYGIQLDFPERQKSPLEKIQEYHKNR